MEWADPVALVEMEIMESMVEETLMLTVEQAMEQTAATPSEGIQTTDRLTDSAIFSSHNHR